MPFTSTGYDLTKYRDIQENLRLSLEQALGTPISSDPDSVIGIINSVITDEIASIEENTQALVSNLSIFTAEGVYLDRLVAYLGLSRRAAQSASGSLKVWRTNEGLVPSAVLFSTNAGEQFYTPTGTSHLLTGCAEVLISPTNVAEGSVHTITINTTVFSYTALLNDTATEVVDYFVTEIANVLSLTTSNDADRLRIAGDDADLNSLSVSYTEFEIVEIASFNYCESVSAKSLVVIENTITNVDTNNPNLLRSNNPLPFSDGLDQETDEELRARHQRSTQIGGTATVPAITARMLQVTGITQAFIIENTTFSTDGSGRPPKSYEVYVVGGDPSDIGQAIWDTKPAGVETVGDNLATVTDQSGEVQSVYWSRPENIYIHVRVTYSLFNEETFPTNGLDGIKDAVKTYGDSLDIGEDVIPTRFIGGIYQSVAGLEGISIEVGSSTNIGDTSPASGWLTSTISILDSQVSDFSLARITLVQV